MYYKGCNLCKLENLYIDDDITKSNQFTEEYREEYAKIALLMFYPLQ